MFQPPAMAMAPISVVGPSSVNRPGCFTSPRTNTNRGARCVMHRRHVDAGDRRGVAGVDLGFSSSTVRPWAQTAPMPGRISRPSGLTVDFELETARALPGVDRGDQVLQPRVHRQRRDGDRRDVVVLGVSLFEVQSQAVDGHARGARTWPSSGRLIVPSGWMTRSRRMSSLRPSRSAGRRRRR